MNPFVRLELIRESLIAVVNEMRANIIHSSYAPIIYEGHDFSCALMSADGLQIAQGLADHPLHIFAVPYSTQRVVEAFAGDIHEGDLFLHNDPYTGGTHLNDVLLLHPVFFEGALAMFAAIRCHWNDVGGMTPGSLSGRVNEVYQEGMRIAPTKICSRGAMNEPFLDLLFNNMRERNERLGDFNAMLGTGRKAAEHIGRLFERFGGRGLLEGIDELMERSEGLLRARIAECPDGDYFADGYIESDGTNPEPLVVRLKLTVDGDTIAADFTGTSAQTDGPTNCGPAMALNGVGTVVKTFLDPDTPINHGSFNPIAVIAPERSIVNARETSPCGGMAEVKFLIDAVVASAMSQVVPGMSVGDLKGGANHIHIAGPAPAAAAPSSTTSGRPAEPARRRASTATTPAAATTRATSTRSSRSRPSRARFRSGWSAASCARGAAATARFAAGSGCAATSASSARARSSRCCRKRTSSRPMASKAAGRAPPTASSSSATARRWSRPTCRARYRAFASRPATSCARRPPAAAATAIPWRAIPNGCGRT